MTLTSSDTRHNRRPISDILCKPTWQKIDAASIADLLSTGMIKSKNLRDLDDYLTFRDEISSQGGEDPDELQQAIVNFAEETGQVAKLKSARKALLLLFDAQDIASEMAQAIASYARKDTVSNRAINGFSGRPLRHSLPESQLPLEWKIALADMRNEFPGAEVPPPAPEVTKCIARSLRQLAKAAVDDGQPIALSREALDAFEGALSKRVPTLSPHTIKKYLKDIKEFSAYVGACPEFRDYLDKRFHKGARRAQKVSTSIDRRVAQVPDFKNTLEMAIDLLKESQVTLNLRSAHTKRNRAAAISVVSAIPLRIADLTLYFGSNITWTGQAYHLFIPVCSKRKVPYATTLTSTLGCFIDRLILRDRPLNQIEDARDACIRGGRALFINYSGEPVHRNYVSRCWWNIFGTGSHVARAKIHDEFARLGPRGVELALAACGHRSEASAEFYRSQAFDSFASAYVKDSLLGGISKQEMQDFFT